MQKSLSDGRERITVDLILDHDSRRSGKSRAKVLPKLLTVHPTHAGGMRAGFATVYAVALLYEKGSGKHGEEVQTKGGDAKDIADPMLGAKKLTASGACHAREVVGYSPVCHPMRHGGDQCPGQLGAGLLHMGLNE